MNAMRGLSPGARPARRIGGTGAAACSGSKAGGGRSASSSAIRGAGGTGGGSVAATATTALRRAPRSATPADSRGDRRGQRAVPDRLLDSR